MLVLSGTIANLVALKTHCRPGDEVFSDVQYACSSAKPTLSPLDRGSDVTVERRAVRRVGHMSRQKIERPDPLNIELGPLCAAGSQHRGVSIRTIEFHLGNIYIKLGIRSRTDSPDGSLSRCHGRRHRGRQCDRP
jgi:hypothetical protein